MPSQVIFLFDLDQCLPLTCSLPSEELERQMSFLKHVCLKLLCSSSSLDGAEFGTPDLACFGFRFYSSTDYFLVPQDVDSAVFYDLSEDNFALFENSISDRLERLWQSSKTNTFEPRALAQHLEAASHRPHAQTLRKALEEIAVLYKWDRPMLDSPVKRDSGKNSDENVVYILTKLPDNAQELNRFLGSGSAQTKIQPNQIYDEVFNQTSNGSHVKNIINVFKGEANVRVNIIDTSSLYRRGDYDVIVDKRVKVAFHRCLKQFRGGVISAAVFEPDVKNFVEKRLPAAAHSIKVSTLLSAYVSEESDKRPKNAASRHGSLKFSSDDSTTVVLNFEPMSEINGDFISGKTQLSLRGLVSEDIFPVDQHFEAHFYVWPSRDQPSWSNLFDRMRQNRQKLLIGLGEDKLGVLSPTFDDVGILSLLNRDDSSFYLLLTRLKSIHTRSEDSLPQNVKLFLDREIQNKLSFLPSKRRDGDDCKIFPFQGDCFDSCKVPETAPFSDVIARIRSTANQKRLKMRQQLQQAYLPARISCLMDKKMGRRTSESQSEAEFPRPRSEDTTASQISSRSKAKTLSRGAELMRLGSKNAELRRHSSEDTAGFAGKSGTPACSKPVSEFLAEKENLKCQLEKEVKDLFEGEESKLVRKLMELQYKLLMQVGANDAAVCALAEVTISSLLNHLQASGKPKTTLEEFVEENFLVDPTIVASRKTSKVQGGRIRDHKLQALYRIEVHWLTASQEKQTELEEKILLHLRQISIWESPEHMVSFLHDAVTPVYQLRQPDLLCLIHDELNLPTPDCLRDLFSPAQKSDCSSVQPSSAHSDAARSNVSSAFDLVSRGGIDSSKPHPGLRRLTSFDSHKMLQIDVGAVQKKNLRTRAATNVNVVAVKKKTGRTPMKKVKRNLTFDGGDFSRRSPRKRLVSAAADSKAQAANKTPRKNVKTPVKSMRTPSKNMQTPSKNFKTPIKSDQTPKKRTNLTDKTPKKEDKTPKKNDFVTPLKMTPGKGHRILAPETPTLKAGRRKSDGKLQVSESPDIDLIKQTKMTPRRMAASVAINKKTSFYSGNVSRNLVKAEEVLQASRIQGSTIESQCFGSANASKRFSDKDDGNSTASILFPHLVRKRKSVGPEEATDSQFNIRDFVSPKKNQADPEIEFKAHTGINDCVAAATTGDEDLFPELDEDGFVSPVRTDSMIDLRIPLRRLFSEDEDKSSPRKKLRNRKESTTTPKKCQTVEVAAANKTPPTLAAMIPIDKTPIKSSSVARTPVKTPAQKRGDLNFDRDHQTPVKTPAQKRGDQNVSFAEISRTPVKTPGKKNLEIYHFESQTSMQAESFRTPVKTKSRQTITPLKSRSPSKRLSSGSTETESVGAQSTERATPKKTGRLRRSRGDLSISDQTSSVDVLGNQESMKQKAQLVKRSSELAGSDAEPSKSEPPNEEASAASLISGRPSRRKSTSFRLGIDDVSLNEIIWSPSGKSAKVSRINFDTPPKTFTPKPSRLASPASAQLTTPTSKLKLRRTPKMNLFVDDTIPETVSEAFGNGDNTSRRTSKRHDSKIEPAQTDKYNFPETGQALRPTLRSKSEKAEQETAAATAPVQVPTIISFSKSAISRPSGVSASDALGRKIVEMSSVNKVLTSETADPNSSSKGRPSVASPKHRTPKRLRSRSNKISPNSKRRKVSVEFVTDPPMINDSHSNEQDRRTVSESRGADDDEETSGSRSPCRPSVSGSPLKSPEKCWSVSTFESPRGEFKLRLVKSKKKQQQQEVSPFMHINRISRRMTHDTGLSPEILNQLIYQSPSPKKKLSTFEKENLTREPATSGGTSESVASPRLLLRRLDTNQTLEQKPKFSPLTSRGLVALTTSPIVNKKEQSSRSKNLRVHKRLYTDDDSDDFV